MSRSERKMDHIQFALSTSQAPRTMFDDIRVVHQALPGLGVEDILLQPETGDLHLKSPVFINAMTGGGGIQTERLNALLARAAKETGMAMAVGSQMSALKNPVERHTYEIVRKENPDGILFANLGSEASVQQAKDAIEMIEANALQIHLNVVQELTMPEGDRDFKGALERIQQIADQVDVPIIVKETGFGISREAARQLEAVNIAAIDVSGFGGTNFAAIENERRVRKLAYFQEWGIPTAAAIVETDSVFSKTVLASGGIQNALDILKAFILGADAAGLAGSFLKIAMEKGEKELIAEIQALHEDLAMMMTALGAKSLPELAHCPAIISGELFHYLTVRGLDPASFASRVKN
ncbi:type 2 isopentenyl-diphosphate Delta-isomerase [Planomicrobium sp. CPCC 101110]|uniref:type 2 isopentenyl-diphosphate Delta-isomerase n=1 Tax=Planomicrobium sp. CPCC 101110 TaxID=2599619 RepID=UPI0011B59614|nr:type 2 isopentenyl-diphosphate Delta-isomerase [Planomicrobium sp. CPCC 101110]TWT28303.1 type 2 isopentenyl-diphosphate Delta-isomerase [Planomicrobium sp. CPCC 101110]